MNVDESQVEDKRDEKWMEEVQNRKEEALLSRSFTTIFRFGGRLII